MNENTGRILAKLSFNDKLDLIDMLKEDSDIEILAYFLTDLDADIRAKSLESLSMLDFTELLIFHINDESAVVRRCVARECGKHNMIPELKYLVHDECPIVQSICISYLCRFGLFADLIYISDNTTNCYLKILINDELKGYF